MAQYDRQTVSGRVGTAAAIDEGLRSHMLRVYNYMGIGLAVTGLVAYFFAQWAISSPAVAQAVYGSPLAWVIMLSPLAFVLVLSFGINKLSFPAAQADLLGLCRRHGPVAVLDLPGLYRAPRSPRCSSSPPRRSAP